MDQTEIRHLKEHVGEEVRLLGWLYNKRSKGKIHFLLVRDGTGLVQAVAFKNDLPPEDFEACGLLEQECSLELTGTVREDARSPGGVEIGVTGIRKIGDSVEYPITKKEHGVEFLMEHRHLWFRSKKQHALLRLRAEVIAALQETLNGWGFVRFDTPLLTPCSAEGTTDLFSTKYFDLGEAYLAQTGQLYVEAGMMAHGKVYCFGPTFRAERSKTRRHLIEFWMLEPEVAFADHEDNMRLQERFLEAVVARVLDRCRAELEILERDLAPLEAVRAPFHRITYDEAVEVIREHHGEVEGCETIPWGEDFGAPPRDAPGPAVRPTGLRRALPDEDPRLLHGAGPGAAGGGALLRSPRAGGLRRDRRRQSADPRRRPPGAADPRARAESGRLSVVSGSPAVRKRAALRIRARPGALPHLDLRDRAHPRDHSLPPSDPPEPAVSEVESRLGVFRERLERLETAVRSVMVGGEEVLDQVLTVLLAGGHALLEGAPGLGKTLLVRTLASSLGLRFGRIQFTPDLMPADVTGTTLLAEDESGRRVFRFEPGPLFGNVILADEVNRATPRTQSALLEAMQERGVTVSGTRHDLEEPFVVLATQNPIEMEGTYPLPEAQLDRFLLKVVVTSPPEDDIVEILTRTTGPEPELPEPVLARDEVLELRELVREVEVAPEVLRYAARLTVATQPDGPTPADAARRWIRHGASPRAAQAMILAGKVAALRSGRLNVALADVRRYALPALRHRLVLGFESEAQGKSPDAVVLEILEQTPEVPPNVARLEDA
jgi:aspartyl/asparaginyl-tRNA synthetase/MoxR-like ATPase